MADVMSFEDFKANGSSEASVRAVGKLRMEGRNYEVQDGDIIHVSWSQFWSWMLASSPFGNHRLLFAIHDPFMQFKFGATGGGK